MKRTALMKVAASSLIVAVTMVGCTSTGGSNRPAIASGKAAGQATKFAEQADKAMQKKQYDKALVAAERAVSLQPDNGAYRTILGRAYLASGRFTSAETAFDDALTLGNADARTIISLALIKIANGKSGMARTLLNDHRSALPAADYGLAIAMAGETAEGVLVLSDAIRDVNAGAKVRQNLAYAFALDGRWREAKLMASQDLAPEIVNQRISAWAQMAQSGQEAQRVSALIGVTPVSDSGMPSQLALRTANEPVEMASSGPVSNQVDTESATSGEPLEIASFIQPNGVAEDNVKVVPVAASGATGVEFVVEDKSAPVIHASKVPVRKAATVSAPPSAGSDTKSMIRKVAAVAPIIPYEGTSAFEVQLGAYESAAIAKDAWQRMAARNSQIAAFPVINSTATVKGKLYHRLSISGFGERNAANQMCASIKAQRGQCFVRTATPGAKPQKWAVSKRMQIASR